MFKTGSYWIPPPVNKYTRSCADESYDKAKLEFKERKGKLSNELELSLSQSLDHNHIVYKYFPLQSRKKEKFEEIMKNLSTERKSISEAMIFCIDNADKCDDIVSVLASSVNASGDVPLNKTVTNLN